MTILKLQNPFILAILLTIIIQSSLALSTSSTQTPTPSHKNLRQHTFSPTVSNQLSTAIKQKIITNLPTFTDQVFAKQLMEDLNQEKDENRKLKQISPQSAEELFKIFQLKGIVCDKNGDGIIIKEELQCLNYIWKYYVPEDSVEN